VAFGSSNPGWRFPLVDVDGAAGMRLVTKHLLEQGHRRIAVLAWPEQSRVGENRLKGYFEIMKAAGIEPPSEWVLRGEGRFSFGRQATEKLLSLSDEMRPTAIAALNDPMAIGAMHAAQEHGLVVGQDIAITGFDDAPMVQYLKPALTSVRQPIWEIGQLIIRMLGEILEEIPLEKPQVLLEPSLVVRASSCCAPHNGQATR